MRRSQETEVTKLTARAQNGEEFTAADVLNDRCPQMNSGTSPRCSRPASKLMASPPHIAIIHNIRRYTERPHSRHWH